MLAPGVIPGLFLARVGQGFSRIGLKKG